jgi:hypothetical protein
MVGHGEWWAMEPSHSQYNHLTIKNKSRALEGGASDEAPS